TGKPERLSYQVERCRLRSVRSSLQLSTFNLITQPPHLPTWQSAFRKASGAPRKTDRKLRIPGQEQCHLAGVSEVGGATYTNYLGPCRSSRLRQRPSNTPTRWSAPNHGCYGGHRPHCRRRCGGFSSLPRGSHRYVARRRVS